MTDLNSSSIVEKRTRFFDGIALNSQDLTTEQEYHIDRHRTHNRLLRTSGILEGLEVMLSADSKTVEVTRGTAIDSLGRLIILGDTARYNERDLAITNDNKYRLAVERYKDAVTLIIKYFEEATDPAIRGRGSEGFARWHEKPILQFIKAGENDGQDSAVALAELKISDNGQITINASDPKDSPAYAGLKLGNNDSETILSPKPGQRLALRGSLSISETLTVSKNLQVDQDLTVGGTLTFSKSLQVGQDLTVDGLSTVNNLTVNENLELRGALTFREQNRQAISFGDDSYGAGLQQDTQYFRTAKNFAWYQSGSHNNTSLNPGNNGKVQMVLADGKLGIGKSNPMHTLDVGGDVGISGSLSINGNDIENRISTLSRNLIPSDSFGVTSGFDALTATSTSNNRWGDNHLSRTISASVPTYILVICQGIGWANSISGGFEASIFLGGNFISESLTRFSSTDESVPVTLIHHFQIPAGRTEISFGFRVRRQSGSRINGFIASMYKRKIIVFKVGSVKG